MDGAIQTLLAQCQRALTERGKNLCETRIFFGKQLKTRCVNQIRVMHWNILANSLSGSVKSDAKSFDCPQECLLWNFRRWRILEEIAIYNPDIITLVELDEGEDLMKDLAPLGYSMKFAQKSSKFADGTGIFWKSSRFEVCDEESGLFNVKPPKESDLKLNQVFHCLAFKAIDGGIPFVICGLHLKATKTQEGEEVRAAQVRECIQRINAKFSSSYPVIICGDFNASRIVYNDIKPSAVKLAIQAGFSSCCEKVMGKELDYTSWKTRSGKTAKYTIDYILASKNVLSKAALGTVPEEKVPKFHFPNFQSGSDHLSLVCDLEIDRSTSARTRDRNLLIFGFAVLIGVIVWQNWRYCQKTEDSRGKSSK